MTMKTPLNVNGSPSFGNSMVIMNRSNYQSGIANRNSSHVEEIIKSMIKNDDEF